MAIATPYPPVLFGSTDAEREASRTVNSLRFDWTDVPSASSYDIQFGGSDIRIGATKGIPLGGLPANQNQTVELRAVNGLDISDWSTPVTFATRPDKPAPPFLASPADRREDSLVLTWILVNGITDYDLQVNGTVLSTTVQTPFTLAVLPSGGPLLPNIRFDIAIRARDAIGGVSEWSDIAVPNDGVFVTRPPKPAVPIRVHSDLMGWSIVLRWQVPSTFSGAPSAFVRLFRDIGSVIGEKLVDGALIFRFVDFRQRMSLLKTYRIQTIIPAVSVPAPIPTSHGGPDNESFESEPLTAKFPFCIKAIRPAAGIRPPAVVPTRNLVRGSR